MFRSSRSRAPLLIVAAGIVASAALLSSAPSAEIRPPEAEVIIARTLPVRPETIRLAVRSQGTVAPRTETNLVAQVSGEIAEVSSGLEPGAFFQKGDLLVRLDPRDLELARKRSAASLARARAEEAFARATLERQLTLQGNGIASRVTVDEARHAAATASATRRELEVDLERAERDLARSEIVAPFDGRTRARQVDVGRFVNVGTPVAVVYAVDYAEVRLPIPDAELAFLEIPLGRELPRSEAPEVRLSASFAGAEHAWTGHIVRTEAAIDPRTRMVQAIARVPNPFAASGDRPPLAPGMFVDAEIAGREVKGLVRIPRSALDAGDVWLVTAESLLERRAVSILRLERDTALVDGGLSPGDRVSLLEPRLAREGMPVQAVAAEALAAHEQPDDVAPL